MGNRYRSCLCNPYMAINTTSTVPTTVRLVAVIHTHGYHIVAISSEIRGQLIAETAVTVRAKAQLMPIEINRRVHIYAIEVDKPTLVIVLRLVDIEMLAIPSDATRQGSTSSPRRVGGEKISFYGPVVRQVEQTPARIIICSLCHLDRVGKHEAPSLIEVLPIACRSQSHHQ